MPNNMSDKNLLKKLIAFPIWTTGETKKPLKQSRLLTEIQFCADSLTNAFLWASVCFLISYIFARIL